DRGRVVIHHVVSQSMSRGRLVPPHESKTVLDNFEVILQCRLRVARVLPLEVPNPGISAGSLQIGGLHGPVPDLDGADVPGLRLPTIPAFGPYIVGYCFWPFTGTALLLTATIMLRQASTYF